MLRQFLERQRVMAAFRARAEGELAEPGSAADQAPPVGSSVIGSAFPPQTTTPTRSPCSGT